MYLLFSLPYNVEVVVPNCAQISRGSCWPAHTIFHHHRIFNVAEIRVWVRTADLHFKSLTILLLVLPLLKQTNDDNDMTGHDKQTMTIFLTEFMIKPALAECS